MITSHAGLSQRSGSVTTELDIKTLSYLLVPPSRDKTGHCSGPEIGAEILYLAAVYICCCCCHEKHRRCRQTGTNSEMKKDILFHEEHTNPEEVTKQGQSL